MVDQTTERTIIAAAPDACYAAAIDFERYPEWASDVKMARILSRDDDGRAVDVEFRAAAMGRSTTYTLRYFYGANPRRLAWRLQKGDINFRQNCFGEVGLWDNLEVHKGGLSQSSQGWDVRRTR